MLMSAIAGFLFSSAAVAGETWPDVGAAVRRAGGSGKMALIVMVEDYPFLPDIPGAAAKARMGTLVVRQSWLSSSLFDQGCDRLCHREAGRRSRESVGPGGRLWIVYIGHGAPGKAADGDTPEPILIGSTRNRPQVARAEKHQPTSPTDVGDFHAARRGHRARPGRMLFRTKRKGEDLVPGLAPVSVVESVVERRTTVLSAARNDQYAGPLNDLSRPAFIYLVLGAMRGWGDADADGIVTSAEAVEYANKAMPQTVGGRQQEAWKGQRTAGRLGP